LKSQARRGRKGGMKSHKKRAKKDLTSEKKLLKKKGKADRVCIKEGGITMLAQKYHVDVAEELKENIPIHEGFSPRWKRNLRCPGQARWRGRPWKDKAWGRRGVSQLLIPKEGVNGGREAVGCQKTWGAKESSWASRKRSEMYQREGGTSMVKRREAAFKGWMSWSNNAKFGAREG